MKIILDSEKSSITIENNGRQQSVPLYSKESFEQLSRWWVKVGWNQKYPYTFTWMGRPVIQLPEDLLRVQEVIFRVKPDVIIETGIAHGGSLIFYASLCELMGKGRVIGVDIEIREHNRKAINAHPMSRSIELVEGSSVEKKTVDFVKSLIQPDETVMVILDSCHEKEHVLKELAFYSTMVSKGSYIVATDGIMFDLYDTPRGKADWTWNNPTDAAKEFAAMQKDFVLESPKWQFNESELDKNITCWPGAWLKKIK